MSRRRGRSSELSIYTPLRMPHHRWAQDDKHSFAPASRFLDDAALAVLDVREAAPAGDGTGHGGRAAPARVELPTLDELWA